MPRTRTYGLDIDTIRFAQRVKQGSGTTILPEPLKQINKFVVGIKKLGLWNSMVCWPMRSIHNAGTGSTVYSLGGYGNFNGTLINSSTWSNRAIVGNNIDDHMSVVNFSSTSRTPSVLFVYNRSRNLSQQTRPLIGNWFNPVGLPLMFGMEWFGQGRSYMQGRDIITNELRGAATFQNGFHRLLGYNSMSIEVAGTSAPILRPFNVYENNTLHGDFNQYGPPGLPFDAAPASVSNFPCFFGNLEISLLLFVNGRGAQTVRSLYRSTLGIGLNLP
jgi:hypothetical protein